MQKVNIELLLAIIFISLGVFFIYSKPEKSPVTPLSITVDQYYLDESERNLIEKNALYGAFEIVDKACPSCLVNIDEYIILLEKEYNIPINKITIYSSDTTTAERIMRIKKWNEIEYKVIDSLELLHNKLVMFKSNEQGFSSSIIPNNKISSLEKKRGIIGEHLNRY